MIYREDQLRVIFQSQFSMADWQNLLKDLFGVPRRSDPYSDDLGLDPSTGEGYKLGSFTTPDHYEVGCYYYRLNGNVDRRRVSLRNLVSKHLKIDADAALAVFDGGDHWRFSFVCDLRGDSTSPKRYSYVLGDSNNHYRTPVDRMAELQRKGITFNNIKEAFSVDALSDDFFDEYRNHYANIVEYLTGKRMVKVDNKWAEKVIHPPLKSVYDQLSGHEEPDKAVRDYVKKMLGRIVFLHFLQKKGWLNGNQAFLRDLFFMQPLDRKADFLEKVLEPLFFGIFNTEPKNREKVFLEHNWDLSLLNEWNGDSTNALTHSHTNALPYLNGGLFERDEVDKLNIKLPATLFEDLFNFLSSYNFTVDENDPDDAEVGVDPEMLGKIFESLLEDNKAKGAFYTPKEIVRYMCKESLIAYLATQIDKSQTERKVVSPASLPSEQKENSDGSFSSDCDKNKSDCNKQVRSFVEHHEFPSELEPYRDTIDTALRNVKICDPAIGSGAFPMGLLNELWRCREALSQSKQSEQKERDNIIRDKNSSDSSFSSDCNKKTSDCTMSRAALKREIIENNIYGVDIERGAIDIARLRFWLSIVVDAEEPEPLPNFDYKFMQGNSLIESFDGHDLSHIMDKRIERNGKTYYQRKIGGKEVIQVSMDFFSEDTRQNLRIWLKKYFSLTDHKDKTQYRQRINESVKSYIVQQGIEPSTAADFDTLDPSANQDFFLWHTWFKDIFDNGGFDIVIGNPPYIRRTELPEEAKKQYERVFKSAVLQYDIYLLFIEFGLSICNKDSQLCFINPIRFFNSDYGKGCRPIIIKNNYLWRVVDVSQIEVFKNAMTYPCVLHIQKQELKEYEIEYYTPQSLQVVNNVQDMDCKYLSKHNIINDQKCRIVVSEENGIIQKIDKISEPIETWFKVARGLPNNKVDFEGKNFKALKSTMVKKYRITESYKWVDTNYYAAFEGEMIILPRTVLYLQATLKEEGIVLLDRIYYLINKISVNTRFVLGIINAKVTNYWFEYFYSTTKVSGGYFDLNGTQIKSIPIPKATPLQQKQIADLVSDILQMKKEDCNANTASSEHEIDKIVYQLYNLTPEEIAIIEGA